MRTPAEISSDAQIPSAASLRFLPLARAAAVAVAFATSATLLADAAAESAPTALAVQRTFAPRVFDAKRDPVDALFAREYRGRGFTIDPHVLPGTFVIKFRDEIKARFAATADGPMLASLTGRDMSGANRLLAYFNASARQWIGKSEGELSAIEAKARDNSGKMQPDLAGMIQISGVATDRLIEAARMFNDLNEVEFVSFDRHVSNLQQGCDPNNAAVCELPSPTCDNPFPGNDDIPRTECNPPAADPRIWGCNDVACCEQVGDFDPTCADEEDNDGWDVWCAAWANLLCTGTIYETKPDDGPYDPCFFDPLEPDPFIKPVFEPVFFEVQNASCLSAHGGRGCRQPACCNSICAIDPSCCADAWDSACANIALSGQISTCTVPPDTSSGQSPDLTVQETPQGLQGFQYYMQGGPRPEQLVDLQEIGDTWKGAVNGGPQGFTGHGFHLNEMEAFQNLIWENYQGGDPTANPFLRGESIRIGIIESSGYTLHEDFILAGPAKNPTRPWEGPLLGEPQVVIEEGQAPIYVEQGPISANHGTNVMGVILGADNGVGVTGVADRAKGVLYPTFGVSGFRGQDAITSAVRDFFPGDVMNFSWGFIGVLPYFNERLMSPDTSSTVSSFFVQPVSSNIAYSVLLGTATDAGITSVVAAGAGPTGITGSSEIDVGLIIVTGIWPGNMTPGTAPAGAAPGYALCELDFNEENVNIIRHPSSNYLGDSAASRDEVPVCSGWGFGVATTGATTRFENTSVSNPELYLFAGVNDAPPTDIAPNLQIDRLRLYTQEFGGTSAAAAQITGMVARMQAAAKQFFGTPLTPFAIRQIIENHPSSYAECICARGDGRDLPFREPYPGAVAGPANSCAPAICTGRGCLPETCACPTWSAGLFPNLQQMPATILNTEFNSGGNDVDVEVITGGRLIGYSWSAFQIRVEDGTFLQINAERATAGTTRQGLTYLSSGLTTDIRVRREVPFPNPALELNGLAIRIVSESTRNSVIAGAFIRNFQTNRYEFVNTGFLTTAGVDLTFNVLDSGTFTQYINPETNEVDVRIWTCGLGATGRHIVKHDLVEILFNPPFEPL